MEMLKAIIILVIGFLLLVKGADYFVDGASSIAKQAPHSVSCDWSYNCGIWNKCSELCSKYVSSIKRQQ